MGKDLASGCPAHRWVRINAQFEVNVRAPEAPEQHGSGLAHLFLVAKLAGEGGALKARAAAAGCLDGLYGWTH
jgi:hypothetical protein